MEKSLLWLDREFGIVSENVHLSSWKTNSLSVDVFLTKFTYKKTNFVKYCPKASCHQIWPEKENLR